jgi:transposase
MPKRKTHSEETSEPKYPLKCFKCGLNRLITDPQTKLQTLWMKEAINDLVKNVSSMMFLGMNLAKTYLLKSLDDPVSFPLPPLVFNKYDKFIYRCMQSVCSNQKPKLQQSSYMGREVKKKDGTVKPKEVKDRDVEYQKPLQQLADDYLTQISKSNYQLPIYKPCFTHSIDLMALQLWTCFQTHVSRNFPSWLKNFFIATVDWGEKIKDLKYVGCMANRMSVFVRGHENASLAAVKKNKNEPWLSEELRSVAQSMKQELEPYYYIGVDKKTKKSKNYGLTTWSIKQNFLYFLKLGHRLLKICEQKYNELKEANKGVKNYYTPFQLYSLIPNKDAHLSHIQIDTSSFGYLFYAYGNSGININSCRKPGVWYGKIFPNDALRKSRLTWRFDNFITTDGVSVSVNFRKIRNLPPQPTSEKKPKVETSTHPWEQNAKEQLNSISDKEKLFLGVDPGRKFVMTICATHPDSGKTSRTKISPFQYNLMLDTYGKQTKLNKLCGYSSSQSPDTTSSKTIDPNQVQDYVITKCNQVAKHPEGYLSETYRKNKWDTFVNKPRIINSFINHSLLQIGYPTKQKRKRKKRINKKSANHHGPKKRKHRKQKRFVKVRQSRKKRFDENIQPSIDVGVLPVFAYGNANFDSAMATTDGQPASCNSLSAKVMQTRQDIKVIEVSEYNTTKNCNLCGNETDAFIEKHFNVQNNRFNYRKSWGTKWCEGHGKHQPKHLHRDGNAALNIRDKLVSLVN